MPESVRTKASAPDLKVERPPADDRSRDARPHPVGLHVQLLDRQRTIGNRAVQRLIKSGAPKATLKTAPGPRHDARTQPAEPSIRPIRGLIASPAVKEFAPARRGAAPHVQRAWYNFDIPFTDYQFDPSIEGVKTAAGLVKDTAVEAFDFIVDKIRDLVGSGIEWLTEKWNAIEKFATSAFTAAQAFFTNIIGFVKNPLGFLADAFMRLDEKSIAKAWATFSGLVSTLANNFRLLTDNLLNPLDSLWSKIHGYGTSLLGKVSGLLGTLPGAVQRIAATVIDPLKRLWARINEAWTKLFTRIKAWVDDALRTLFDFVRRVLSFGINVVIEGIVQFGKLVLFIKDLFSEPQRYAGILAGKAVQALTGVESLFSGMVAGHLGGGTKAEAPAAPPVAIQRQAASDAPAEVRDSATWSEIGNGVLAMMGKKWEEFKADPLSVVMGLLLDMVLPLVGNVKDVIHLFQEIKKIVTGPLSAGSLEELWTSFLLILDIPILIYQTVVSILMRSLTLPLIVASFVPHPLVKAIAAAVGWGLLGAFVNTELANLGQKVLLLKTGATTKDQKTDAYNRVADGLIAMAMTAVILAIVAVLHFMVNVAKGVYNLVKAKFFPVERAPVKARPGSTAEGKGKGGPEEGKAAEAKGAKEAPSEDGQRKLRLNEEGRCEVCASPCDDVRRKYAKVMTPEIEAKISAIEKTPGLTEAQQLQALKPVEQKLADLTKNFKDIGDWERAGDISPEDAADLRRKLQSEDPALRREAKEEMAELSREAEGKPHENKPKKQRMSDAAKAELENSGWLKKRLPDAEHRRQFMEWLQKRHESGSPHDHLSPGSPYAERMLGVWSAESGVPIVTHPK